ncbi:hypothetical protein OA50_05035 [Mameliella alba]|uniref:Uncharacterized protein n=1 Tax=Mameliella alba TaxID=561184 RepID=A0A0B3RGE0_9RHOB|nr:hypothetical protein OA50_05035 [Mameliella alba]
MRLSLLALLFSLIAAVCSAAALVLRAFELGYL